jgi:hypothetical protein
MMLHQYSLNPGALAAIAEQFNGVVASQATILAGAIPLVHPAASP